MIARTPLARGIRNAMLGLSAISLVTGTSLSAQAVQVGVAASVVGDVRMNSAAQSKQRKIERKQRMAWGDHVETRKKSRCRRTASPRAT
jgi:hypothetical protein